MVQARRELVIDPNQLTLSRNVFLGFGWTATLVGAMLALTNPQISDQSRDTAIYLNGVSTQAVKLPPMKTFQNLGLGLGFLGISSIVMSNRLNNHIALETVTDIEEAAIQVSKNLEKAEAKGVNRQNLTVEQAENIFYPVLALIQEHKWLVDAINCHAVIIVGGSGSGKSRLASSIAMLSAIVKQGEIIIGDPDAKQNLVSNCWKTGDIYGAYEPTQDAKIDIDQGKEIEVLKCLERAKDPTRSALSKFQAVIFDEISKYSNYTNLALIIPELIKGGSQEARKRCQQYIYLVHTLTSGGWGLDDDDNRGVLNTLYKTACILYMVESKPPTTVNLGSDIGTGRRAETMYHKPSGVAITSQGTPPDAAKPEANRGTWFRYNLPQNLDPVPLSKFLQPFINMLGLNVNKMNVVDGDAAERDKVVRDTANKLAGAQQAMYLHLSSKLSPDLKPLLTKLNDHGTNFMVSLNVEQIRSQFCNDVSSEKFTAMLAKDKAVALSTDKKSFRFEG